MNNDRRRFKPWYDNRADYNTNAKSYYDDLARKQKLIQLLSERIWEYDEELGRRFEDWDKNIEMLPDDLKRMLNDWIKDGTLSEIINKELMYSKVDKIEHRKDVNRLDDRIDNVTVYGDGVSKNEIVKDVLFTINKQLLSNLENKIIDGDFQSNSYSDNFVSLFSRGSFTENNTAILTSNQSHHTIGGTLIQQLKQNFPSDEKWYIVSKVKSLNTGISDIVVGFRGSQGETVTGTGEVNDVRINHYYTLSHVYDPDLTPTSEAGYEGEFNATVSTRYPNGSDHDGKSIEIDYVMAFNLTEIFGYGNEPEKEFMDYILSLIPESYFDGKLGAGRTSTLNLRLILDLFNMLEDNDKSDIKNGILNPRFIRYTTSQGGFKWSHDGTYRNTNDGVFTMRGTGVNQFIRLNQDTGIPIQSNKKVFVQTTFTARNSDVNQVGMAIYGSETTGNIQYVTENNVPLNEKITVSGIVTLDGSQTGNVWFQARCRYPSAELGLDKEVDVEEPLIIDLSETFGYGNEPSVDVMRKFMQTYKGNYFESNASVKQVNNAHLKMFMSGSYGESVRQPLLAITIDDGFDSDYNLLYPALKERGLNATSFVVPDWIDNRTGFMTVDNLKEMQNTGWDIQCHTLEHPRLAEQTRDEIHRQFQGVDDWFELHGLGKPKHHAFPYGSHNSDVVEIGMQYRKSLRKIGLHSDLYNTYDGIDWSLVNAKAIDNMTDEQIEDRKEELKEVIRNGGFHVVICHRIKNEVDGDYQTKLSHLLDIVDSFIKWGGKVVTMSEAYEILDIWK